jgi:5-methylcytosine-specific restriction endonuclease McrA
LHKTTAFDIDHVTPLADGGEDVPENMQLLCSGCHADKTRTESMARYSETSSGHRQNDTMTQ